MRAYGLLDLGKEPVADLPFALVYVLTEISSSYFRSKFHCFDAFVILLAFIIDVLLHGVLEEIASLVVVLRLWRVFKIVEELSGAAEEQMDGLRERIADLEEENEKLKSELQEARSTV